MAQVCSKDPVVDRSVPDVAATVGGDGGRLHLHLQPPGSALGSRLVLTQVLMAHQVEMVGGSTSTFNHLGSAPGSRLVLTQAPPPPGSAPGSTSNHLGIFLHLRQVYTYF